MQFRRLSPDSDRYKFRIGICKRHRLTVRKQKTYTNSHCHFILRVRRSLRTCANRSIAKQHTLSTHCHLSSCHLSTEIRRWSLPASNLFTAGMSPARIFLDEFIVLDCTEFKVDGLLHFTRLALLKEIDQKLFIANEYCCEATELLPPRRSPESYLASFSNPV